MYTVLLGATPNESGGGAPPPHNGIQEKFCVYIVYNLVISFICPYVYFPMSTTLVYIIQTETITRRRLGLLHLDDIYVYTRPYKTKESAE